MRSRITGVVAAVAAFVAVTMGASPASAESFNGCAWPRVCFYLTMDHWWAGTPTSSFQDVTSSYQNLGSRSRGSDWVHNSRNDDRVWLRYTVNSTGAVEQVCLNPNTMIHFDGAYTVTGVRIEWADRCPGT
ncbi:hypothetical protein FE697_020280 [Mumia zhuanghuii]|nr:hypothetical protein FE697_020280 [Mumia zhuanghuii]